MFLIIRDQAKPIKNEAHINTRRIRTQDEEAIPSLGSLYSRTEVGTKMSGCEPTQDEHTITRVGNLKRSKSLIWRICGFTFYREQGNL